MSKLIDEVEALIASPTNRYVWLEDVIALIQEYEVEAQRNEQAVKDVRMLRGVLKELSDNIGAASLVRNKFGIQIRGNAETALAATEHYGDGL